VPAQVWATKKVLQQAGFGLPQVFGGNAMIRGQSDGMME